VDGLLPPQHLARFIWEVLSRLDFSALEDRYRSIARGPGRPPYHPRVLAALWIYGMTQGLETAAGIARACTGRDDFRWLAGGLAPRDQTLLNFLTDADAGLAALWEHVLTAMQQAGHIDLSVLAEDGTKLRANASPRSFLTAPEITGVIDKLKTKIADTLTQLASGGENGTANKAQRTLRTLRGQLARAEAAARELDARLARRGARGSPDDGTPAMRDAEPATVDSPESPATRFTRHDFRLDPDRTLLLCPADQELRFLGQYPTDSGRGAYRLYGRRDCRGCVLKARCTEGKGRRVKMPAHPAVDPQPPPAVRVCPSAPATTDTKETGAAGDAPPGGPKASITEPEAVMMLATSEKRWQPSYNADLAVTRHGIIVSQLLTKDTTDFHHFAPALRAVLSTVGKPESWVGDGHYGTQANVLLADREGVLLYAPPAGGAATTRSTAAPATPRDDGPRIAAAPSRDAPGASTEKFGRQDFRADAERGVMICPAGRDLRLMGVYRTANGLGGYRLYGRTDCRECAVKSRCTASRGRRLKVPLLAEEVVPRPPRETPRETEQQDLGRLLQALAARMADVGDAVLRFRRQTVEPVNAQLKQHGLGRFHVHGLARCAAILTLACIAHNLMKWRAREAARLLRAAA
jgi:transposase